MAGRCSGASRLGARVGQRLGRSGGGGRALPGEGSAPAWQAPVVAVSVHENTAVPAAIAQNTLAVPGLAPERRSEWRETLTARPALAGRPEGR